jgi:hypothetical protein
MKSNSLPLWLSTIGGLLVIPGVLWVPGTGARLTEGDVSSALQPLARIHFGGVFEKPQSVNFVVPGTTHWTRVRQAWGEPELVFSAVDPTGRIALCLPEMPLRIELSDSTGRVIALRPGSAPYGYSADCERSSLRFRAAAGDELTLKVTKSGEGASKARVGDLIVKADWFNLKDKFVGVYLDKDVDSLRKWPLLAGSLFLLSGATVFIRNRVRQHSRN